MSEKIIDKNLEKIIKLKMSTSNIKAIDEIKDISIQNINLTLNRLNIDLTEIKKLKNLKSLSLKFFEITDDIIEAINELKYVEYIDFATCIFKTKKMLLGNLKSIIIDNCQNFTIKMFEKYSVIEELQIIHSGIINISDLSEFQSLKYLKIAYCSAISIPRINILENLEQLYLNHLDIPYDMDISKMKKLKLISLSGSNVSNKELYIKKLLNQNNELTIIFEENDLPIDNYSSLN